MPQQLNFKISSALKNIIGKDLITNEFVAVFELVKNSYDAHATHVIITFENNSLTISDNGKGMSYDDLINKWLFVAYSAKKDGTEDLKTSVTRKDYRDEIQDRMYYAGAKGIGRFSCDRLGQLLTLVTKKNEASNCEKLNINWDHFDKDQEDEFINIPVEHTILEHNPQLCLFPKRSNHGTILKIENLWNDWKREEIITLKQSLEKLINPFSDQLETFAIEIKCDKELQNDEREKAKGISQRFIVNGIIENTILNVLDLKTTKIDVEVSTDNIYTTITDRGTDIYKVREVNSIFPLLEDVKITLLFLNRSAKLAFKKNMGLDLKNYGSVFLFKNGFRIYPFGNPGDDSWKLDYRSQQGYNRYLGTRDLFGRVEITTDNQDQFREVSSRDGGLIQTTGSEQLMEAFIQAHRRLERYVVGVLWGEGFVREQYFKSQKDALDMRTTLKEDKDSDNIGLMQDNIGSKLDFLHIMKSLVNDKDVEILYYNQDLVDIVSDKINEIKPQFISDLEEIAIKTNNRELNSKLLEVEKEVFKLQKEKDRLATQLEKQTQRRYEAETAKNNAEIERDFAKTQTKYFKYTKTSPEVLDVLHSIQLSSSKLSIVTSNILGIASNNADHNLLKEIDKLRFHIEKIDKLSELLTKANIKFLGTQSEVDIPTYIKEYLSNYEVSISDIILEDNLDKPFSRIISPLDLSVIIDNLVSNSKKAGATQMIVDFNFVKPHLYVDFSDNGTGVNEEILKGNGLFYTGVSTTRGGSGIGLSMIKEIMEDSFYGDIMFLGNSIKLKGASFRLKF